MIVTAADLTQLLNQEIIEEITRNDDSKATKAIAQAIDMAKAYMSRFDLIALFGVEGQALDNSEDNAIAPTVTDDFLNDIIINIAVWKLVKLCNANVLYDSVKSYYEDALRKLERIQDGKITPQLWPYYVPESTEPLPGTAVQWSSTDKRNNHI